MFSTIHRPNETENDAQQQISKPKIEKLERTKHEYRCKLVSPFFSLKLYFECAFKNDVKTLKKNETSASVLSKGRLIKLHVYLYLFYYDNIIDK